MLVGLQVSQNTVVSLSKDVDGAEGQYPLLGTYSVPGCGKHLGAVIFFSLLRNPFGFALQTETQEQVRDSSMVSDAIQAQTLSCLRVQEAVLLML